MADADGPAEPWPEHPTRDFPVWVDNWPVVDFFLRLATQWRRTGMAGVPTGLDYPAVALLARGLRFRLTPERWDDLQAMEAAALGAWAEITEKQHTHRH